MKNINAESVPRDYIQLEFKIISYHNEKLILLNKNQSFNLFDKCEERYYKRLIYFIQKGILIEIMSSNQDTFSPSYIDNKYGKVDLELVNKININYNNIIKEDVFEGITKLIKNKAGSNSYIAYETNVTSISNILMGLYSFELQFENGKEQDNYTITYLRQYSS